ncbi:hypothetical protein NEOKW01_0453 [Nematocida sp. AWRm80]|nr:hypothetical protein NEOKW01_0453 [Nematocida sp. AWRm80]
MKYLGILCIIVYGCISVQGAKSLLFGHMKNVSSDGLGGTPVKKNINTQIEFIGEYISLPTEIASIDQAVLKGVLEASFVQINIKNMEESDIIKSNFTASANWQSVRIVGNINESTIERYIKLFAVLEKLIDALAKVQTITELTLMDMHMSGVPEGLKNFKNIIQLNLINVHYQIIKKKVMKNPEEKPVEDIILLLKQIPGLQYVSFDSCKINHYANMGKPSMKFRPSLKEIVFIKFAPMDVLPCLWYMNQSGLSLVLKDPILDKYDINKNIIKFNHLQKCITSLSLTNVPFSLFDEQELSEMENLTTLEYIVTGADANLTDIKLIECICKNKNTFITVRMSINQKYIKEVLNIPVVQELVLIIQKKRVIKILKDGLKYNLHLSRNPHVSELQEIQKCFLIKREEVLKATVSIEYMFGEIDQIILGLLAIYTGTKELQIKFIEISNVYIANLPLIKNMHVHLQKIVLLNVHSSLIENTLTDSILKIKVNDKSVYASSDVTIDVFNHIQHQDL